MTQRLLEFLAQERPATPVLALDLDRIEASYGELRAALPEARVHYAVKANPAPEIVRRLVARGSCFDVASLSEAVIVLDAGAPPARISFGNTVKKECEVAAAFARGIRMFAVDAPAEVRKVARAAPGSRVFCRIMVENGDAEWPLSSKFGCHATLAAPILRLARTLGLVPWGVSFHVGSQQTNPERWDDAIRAARKVFDQLEREGIALGMLNLGGGFPARYRKPVPPVQIYAERIRASLERHFSGRMPEILIEPGRGLVGDAGVIETEVILISGKGNGDSRRWVFVDIGKFGGLPETTDECIQYRIECDRQGPPSSVVLAGPTCDSLDILYERTPYELPADLEIGDRLRILGAGAYTQSYSSVGFNGFGPLSVCCV